MTSEVVYRLLCNTYVIYMWCGIYELYGLYGLIWLYVSFGLYELCGLYYVCWAIRVKWCMCGKWDTWYIWVICVKWVMYVKWVICHARVRWVVWVVPSILVNQVIWTLTTAVRGYRLIGGPVNNRVVTPGYDIPIHGVLAARRAWWHCSIIGVWSVITRDSPVSWIRVIEQMYINLTYFYIYLYRKS